MKKQVLAIINPIAGTNGKTRLFSQIKSAFNDTAYITEIETTRYAGHASELARKAVSENFDCVIAVGGDGTVNEIAKETVQSDTALGIIPAGSGNGLARDLRIPVSVKPALDIIRNGRVTTIDYGTANEIPFFGTFGVGFDARVSERFARSGSRGFINYVKNTIEEYTNFKPESYRVVTKQGEIFEEAFLVNCANASQMGNNAYIAPQARLQDGKMTVTILKPFSPFEVLPLAFQLFNKMIDKNSHIITFESDSISIERQKKSIAHIDGEPIYMDAEIKIKTVSSGLKVIAPE